jgi:capsular exopolysaccharide synthesis family protein
MLTAVTPKSYTATTTLFLGSPASVDSAGAYSGDLFSQQRATTYSNLVASRDLAVKVIDDLGLSMTPEELSTEVTASQVPKTVLVDLSVTDTSATRAADIANAYASAFVSYVARLETPVGAATPTSVVTVIQNAEAPTSPTAPNMPLNVALGAVVGLVIGLLASWLKGKLDRTVRTPRQLAECTGAPVLGVLPKDAACSGTRMDVAADSTSAYSEAVRKLRTNLLYADVDDPPKTIAFVAPTSAVSSTATATNLAIALDGISRHTALVDADLRQPRMAGYLNLHSDRGLTSVVSGDAVIDDVLVKVPDTGIDVVLSGPTTSLASELLASDVMAKVLAELRDTHDFVFCDTPGLLSATDAAVISRLCDGVIVVARQGTMKIQGLAETVGTLRNLGAKVLGVVLTDTR